MKSQTKRFQNGNVMCAAGDSLDNLSISSV